MRRSVPRQFLALSVTTTGADPRRDRVVSVALVAVDPSGARQRFEASVKDDRSGGPGGLPGGASGPSRATRADWSQIAAEVRERLQRNCVVVNDAERKLAVLAAEGVRLDHAPIDIEELASILVPGLSTTDLPTLAETLGVAREPTNGA
jgi:DNA polymerase III epsilon subunit-like protein